MADNDDLGEPTGPDHRAGCGGAPFGGVAPMLDRTFDSDTLSTLRADVRAGAERAGLANRRVSDVVLAVHELAANAVRHGAGGGRLRMWNLAGTLHCQVDDGDPPPDPAAGPGDPDASSQIPAGSLPDMPGHGLWVVRHVADQMQILSAPGGTLARVSFDSGRPARD
jgi:anti-sigma regulatory factor (Ser/Thr protein kinase)